MHFRLPQGAPERLAAHGEGVPPVPIDFLPRELLPQVTDPAIDDWLEAHFVACPSPERALGRLLVFLCGSLANRGRQHGFLGCAVAAGYHAINLRYPNRWVVGTLCRQYDEADLHGRIRRQIISSGAHTNLVHVTRPNCIYNRLLKALAWLRVQQPDQGWGRFSDGIGIDWSRVVLAGHSQGGGHVAMIAKQVAVARVLMLAAPADYERRSARPAPWLARPGFTAPQRYFGFVHRQDPGFSRVEAAWYELGLSQRGPFVDVDVHPAPYHGSQQLYTSAQPAVPSRYHASVVVDGSAPFSAGQFMFKPVWDHLLTTRPEDFPTP